ncbi:membrane protease YdiL (CAAX protease family) [Acetoanaerobium pronyense]|uniref:Membrane protease YdiL (CAAX protease family) n=1 Tax=Acetoanaerobium pronyense TaxID=1482736 RepID=A0ABS4KHH1_9FIRM|nr:CPBP family intramembrane glutamic endopeptidase [Acetoanaerobium pronyense]MBP2027237.1 membrane protease YdiL (CAAX protease family) [Acetoanaerobium pronyense]
MEQINIFHSNIYKIPKWKFIVIMGLVGFLLNILLSNISYYILDIDVAADYYEAQDILLFTVLSAVVISPFIETLIFQALVLNSLKTHRIRLVFKILVSAFSFGILHLIYNVMYGISAFIIGIILAYSFVVFERKNQNPIIVVTLIHSLINLLTLIISSV